LGGTSAEEGGALNGREIKKGKATFATRAYQEPGKKDLSAGK